MSKFLKVIVAGACVALVLTLSGCGSSDTSSQDTSSQDTSNSYVAPTTTPTEDYLYALHLLGDSNIETTDDSTLVTIGNEVCNVLDKGYTIEQLITYLAESGAIDSTNAESVGKIIGAAVVTLCPAYTGDVQNYINQNS